MGAREAVDLGVEVGRELFQLIWREKGLAVAYPWGDKGGAAPVGWGQRWGGTP